MKSGSSKIAVAIALFLFVQCLAHATTDITIGFSPSAGSASAEDVVVSAIKDARKSIRVAAYSFTSKRIALELVAAYKRGISVRIVADKKAGGGKYSATTFCANQGIPVRHNDHYAIMHNKFVVIDDLSVETGSFNFTQAAAKSNAENAIYIQNAPETARTYVREWERLWAEGIAVPPRY